MIASNAIRHRGLHTFSIRGAKINSEVKTAAAIAEALGIEMVQLTRSFDHYADSAKMGVRISGGMGSISSNHFLGFRQALLELGCENLITGCYFDYLFKSLAIDTRESRWLRREQLTGYHVSSYLPYFPAPEKYAQPVRDRLEGFAPRFPAASGDSESRFQLMVRRTFPLCREGDNIQRLIAQRVFGWYSPAAFRDILEIYWRTPISARLNKAMFKEAVRRSVPQSLRGISDTNTELSIDASPILVSLFRYRVALRRHFARRSRSIDSTGSWLNWGYYLRHSRSIKSLWCDGPSKGRDLIEELTCASFSEDLETYMQVSPEFFLRLLTLKLWAEQNH
jgi:asparagine synthase (glutamine-hydrolysing)